MKANPYLYAIGAVLYIGGVVSFLRFIEILRRDTADSLLDGVAFIALAVLSAAVMAFLFFLQPVLLMIDSKKSSALSFFLKTVGTFAALTALLLILVSLQ